MKSKKAFMLGAAMAATCFISAFALAGQTPQKLTSEAVKQAVDKALKTGAKLDATKVSASLKHKLQAAKSGQSKALTQSAKAAPFNTPVDELKKPGQAELKSAALAAFEPLFPTLDTNTLYTINGVAQGEEFAYHFNLPQNARVQVQLVGQSVGTDMSLTLFQDDGQGNLSVVGSSDAAGNTDEYLNGVLPAGDYYWYMVAKVANNSQFSFGVAVDTNIDAYEPNDTAQTAFVLPDSMNKVTGNLDNANDVDYFDFKAVRGQSVSMYLAGDANGSRDQWIFDRFDGVNWVTVPAGSTSTYPSVTPGTTVKVRVRANPAVVQDPTKQYQLSLGSSPRLNASDVKGDNIVRVPVSVFALATQTARTLNWSTNWSDSTGAPLLGVTPVLRVDKRFDGAEFHWADFKATTNSAGSSLGSANIGDCLGDYRVVIPDSSTGVAYNWDTTFNFGGWRIELDEFPGVGVGGDNVQYVSLGHICTQNIVH
ncbi:pre-peptidase C-terminal domain-containing protein [Pseudomonas sp. 18175]|uniref:pre-peptidase C-terminal domain-containing protein n=1 Tax=Pseudomonas sp. 18175 TaxID=3390056 RepID=UPI003D2553E5